MANGRIINVKISRNKLLPRLMRLLDEEMGVPHGAQAVIVYTWCIAHLDVEGRLNGDPVVVRGQVVSRLNSITDEHVERYLVAMAEVGLVDYYEADGDRWLNFRGFHGSQLGLRKDREAASTIPSPAKGKSLARSESAFTAEDSQSNSVITPEQVRNGVSHNGELNGHSQPKLLGNGEELRSESGVTPGQQPQNRREEKLRENNINTRAGVDAEADAWRQKWAAATGIDMPDSYSLKQAQIVIARYAGVVNRPLAETEDRALAAFRSHIATWSHPQSLTPQLFLQRWDAIQGVMTGSVPKAQNGNGHGRTGGEKPAYHRPFKKGYADDEGDPA